MWAEHPNCINVIKYCWKAKFYGCHIYTMSQKLELLKVKLKAWNKEIFGNIHHLLNNATTNMNDIQAQIQSDGHNDDLIAKEQKAQLEMAIALKLEELFWHEKSNVRWHNKGHRNTAYFHRIAKIKNCTKHVSTIQHKGVTYSRPEYIYHIFSSHLEQLFNSCNDCFDNSLVDEVVPQLINDHFNALLNVLPNPEEIKIVVFSLSKNSSPGPDGFGGFFFQYYWDVIHTDAINATAQFFSTGWILPNWNANNIVLIPK
ncbi:unnamed protein product [Lathyrus sativus]|nr:unnamed protein product [Lathyrus sativus]